MFHIVPKVLKENLSKRLALLAENSLEELETDTWVVIARAIEHWNLPFDHRDDAAGNVWAQPRHDSPGMGQLKMQLTARPKRNLGLLSDGYFQRVITSVCL